MAARVRFWHRLPVVHQLRQSVGLQRAMLVIGLVLVGVLLLVALFAPWIAPYGWAQRGEDGVLFGTQQPPNSAHWSARPSAATTCTPASSGVPRPRSPSIVVAMLFSIVHRRRAGAGLAATSAVGSTGCSWSSPMRSTRSRSLLLAIVAAIVISGGQSSFWGGITAAAIAITVDLRPAVSSASSAPRCCASSPSRSSSRRG